MLIELIQEINKRKPSLIRFRDFYDGNQPLMFVGTPLQEDFGKRLAKLNANRCNAVIEAVLDRLDIIGFEDDAAGDNEARAYEFWRSRNMDDIGRQVMADAMIAGDGYAICWPTPDGIDVAAQNPEQMAVWYSDESPDVLEAAVKVWKRRDGTWRANLYLADRIEKYVSKTKAIQPPDGEAAWDRYTDGNEAWPLMHSLGRVPVFHFGTAARQGSYGRSDLADIIPLQEKLNQTLATEAVAIELGAYKQRYAIGVQVEVDPETGQPINPFEAGADSVWMVGNEGAKFGEFSSADIAQIEAALAGDENRIAITARVPSYMLGLKSDVPSGEALSILEGPFVNKVKARQRAYGTQWAALMNFVLASLGVKEPRVRVVWRSAESRQEGEMLRQALQKLTAGISPQTVWAELGYSEEQIDEIFEQKAEAERLSQQIFDAA